MGNTSDSILISDENSRRSGATAYNHRQSKNDRDSIIIDEESMSNGFYKANELHFVYNHDKARNISKILFTSPDYC